MIYQEENFIIPQGRDNFYKEPKTLQTKIGLSVRVHYELECCVWERRKSSKTVNK